MGSEIYCNEYLFNVILLLSSSRKDPEKRNLLEIQYLTNRYIQKQKIRLSISFMADLARVALNLLITFKLNVIPSSETNQKILKTSKIVIFR